MRRHGWQRPLRPLQIVGMAVYSFLVVAFYTFVGLFLGNKTATITVISIFSFMAFSVMVLFIRCTGVDPTDKTSSRKKRKAKSKGVPKFNYGYVLSQLVVRFFRRVERKILRSFIKRTYLDPWKSTIQMEPLLPFPLVVTDDAVTPQRKEEEDISYCSICDLEVKRNSKHCRTCDRCVEGFDHHCRWLNNCVGKRNYSTFVLLMIFILLMLIMEGGTAIAIFVRCFVDKKEIEVEMKRRLYVEFPRWLLATISVVLVLITAYGSAAMGQLFFFHLVLIRKGIRTYDYILAMREENQFAAELDPFDDTDSSSDESSDLYDSPERCKPAFISRFTCERHGSSQELKGLSIRVDEEPSTSALTKKKPGFRASINPWKLIKLSREKALVAAEKARERLTRKERDYEKEIIKPLPLETKAGPSVNSDKGSSANAGSTSTPLIPTGKLQVSSPGRFSSPRRRFSSGSSGVLPSPKQKYRSNFDLKLTEVSRELETYISRQVLCSVIKQAGSEASPR